MPIDLLLAYTAACVAVVIVPGPSVTLIIANSLRHGTRAGLWTDGGTQAGLATMLVVLAAGLSTIVNHMGWIFDWLRLVGAAYLIWLGIKLWRGGGGAATSGTLAAEPGGNGGGSGSRFFWQGFLVLWSNPKALLFFGAFIPQFIDPQGSALAQTLLLGLIFIVVAAILDSGWALAAGRAGRWLTGSRMRVMERISGSFLIGGGLWLALSRRV
ncbi:MAG: LysE family translocator [Alphaproteobacteria bacterium]|nr:LysE family translocator [Alphaproteobacteria bacterium]